MDGVLRYPGVPGTGEAGRVARVQVRAAQADVPAYDVDVDVGASGRAVRAPGARRRTWSIAPAAGRAYGVESAMPGITS